MNIHDAVLNGNSSYLFLPDLYKVAYGLSDESAKELSDKFNMRELSVASPDALMKIKGIGKSTATRIVATFELGRRVETFQQENVAVCSPKAVFSVMYPLLRGKQQEEFWCLYLDTKNKIKRKECITVGILDSSIIHPREIFRRAIELQCKSIILCHNHPSGNPEPSYEDKRFTQKLTEAGEIIGIDILDHVIIGDSFYSFKEGAAL